MADLHSISLSLPTLVAALFLCSCISPRDTAHTVVVSVKDQKLVVLERGKKKAVYPVSTSKFGIGDTPGSYATPEGRLVVARKIGTGAPAGAVFKSRKRTGEILKPNAPGRDPIVSRILWLKGTSPENRNSFARYIYIHGTTEEKTIGTPASYGCIRMRSRDVIDLYRKIGVGAEVQITREPLRLALAQFHPLRDTAGGTEEPQSAPMPTKTNPAGDSPAIAANPEVGTAPSGDSAFADPGADTVRLPAFRL
jgi:hypothetical protein